MTRDGSEEERRTARQQGQRERARGLKHLMPSHAVMALKVIVSFKSQVASPPLPKDGWALTHVKIDYLTFQIDTLLRTSTTIASECLLLGSSPTKAERGSD